MTAATRPATQGDYGAIAGLYRRWETHWHGAPENDDDEVAEELDTVELAAHSTVVADGGELVGCAWWRGHDSALLVDPAAADPVRTREALLDWFGSSDALSVTHLEKDAATCAAIRDHGWRHVRSSFELLRDATGWELPAPSFPDDVQVRPLDAADLPAVHELVYVDARWADVPGHLHRGYDEWRTLIANDATLAHPQPLLWRGDRLVGAALGRVFSDGTGWVAQLAVAADERGHGLGRSLLTEALRRRVAEGAVRLGLAVQAENRDALRLYLDVGLQVDREWQTFER